MAEEHEGWYTALGALIILLVFFVTIYSARSLYQRWFPSSPAEISLSAYFVDDKGAYAEPGSDAYRSAHLKILGSVSKGGQPVADGLARVTVSSTGGERQVTGWFRQSVSLPLQKDGKFETEDAAFRFIRPGESVLIAVDVTGKGITASASTVLNSRPPADRTTWEIGIISAFLLLAIIFCWAFTGRKTAAKNQTAIIFSYVVIAIFLGVPIVAPDVLLRLFPEAVGGMIGAPAGLINTHTPNQDAGETQWALNIGGYSFTPPETQASATGTAAGSGNNATTGGATPAAATDAATAVKPASSTTGAADSASTPSQPTPLATARAALLGSSTNGQNAPVVKVQGGLVIPLYVIILSVIGGAINMTRKVPRFQQEDEQSDFSLARPISRVGEAVFSPFRSQSPASEQPAPAAPAPAATEAKAEQAEPAPEDQAKSIQEELEPLVKAQVLRNCETDDTLKKIRALVSNMQDLYKNNKADRLLGFGSFEDWAASQPRIGQLLRGTWRVELLNQYMYLISAPFLAIVTYYILDLLGLSKQGVVVVLSFSVGLVSEKIVSWILGIATGYLRTDTSGAAQAKA